MYSIGITHLSGKINHQIKRAKLYICCVGFFNWFQLNSHSMFNSTNTGNSMVLCAKVDDSNMDITCWLGGTRKGPVHSFAARPVSLRVVQLWFITGTASVFGSFIYICKVD